MEILSFYTYMCTINEDHMIYGSWNIRCDRQKFLSFWDIFCPFSPLTTPWKKMPGDIIILHISTINDNRMMYGSWDMEHDRHNFLSFWNIFCFFTPSVDPENQNFQKKWENTWGMYGSWDTKCNRQDFLSFWTIFCPFTPLYWPRKFLKKLRKTPEDIILQICTINDNHRLYGSSDMEHDRQNFLSFWTVFCPFTPLTAQMKKPPGDVIILHRCNINNNLMMYGSWDTKHGGQKFLSCWTVFCPVTLLTTQKSKFWKTEKNARRYHHFTQVYQKSWSCAVLFLRYGAW